MNFTEYVEYVRTRSCCICFKFPVDAHHLEAVGMGNNREINTFKDLSCIPLCREHHNEYHNSGLKTMDLKYNVNLWQEAFRLFRGQVLYSSDPIIIEDNNEPRTKAQNDFYHGTVCRVLSDYLGYERNEMHEVLKEFFKVESTTTLSKIDFTYYLDRITRWAATEHNVIIPDAIKK